MSKDFKEKTVYDKYIYDIKHNKSMTIEEERQIFVKVKNGDMNAYKEIIERHLKFVISIAKEYKNDFLTLDDLISEGNFGLLKAMEKYNPETGFRFMTYAVWWVRQSILYCLNKYSRTIRLPENIIGELKNNTYEKETATCIPLLNLVDADNEYNIADYFVDAVVEEPLDLNSNLKKILTSLKDREKIVIEMYYGLDGNSPLNLEEISLRLNISKERVRQVKNRSIRKLKHKSMDLLILKNE